MHCRKVGKILHIPDSKLHEIDREYPTDDEREGAVIRYWTLRDPYASWRRIIEELDRGGKHERAHRICHYAEELTGMNMTCMCIVCLFSECLMKLPMISFGWYTYQSTLKTCLVCDYFW